MPTVTRDERWVVPLTCFAVLAGLMAGIDFMMYRSHINFSLSSNTMEWHDRNLAIMNEDGEIGPLFPLTAWDYVGFLSAIFGLIIAAGGGIGGGGILVPIYILILQFPVKHAIPLSNVTVFGGAVANTILNSRKRHPYADRPLVNWELVLMMEPLTMAGALVGADVNELLPEVVIVIMLVVLLGFTAYKTLTKANKMHQQESEYFALNNTHDDSENNPKESNAVTVIKHPLVPSSVSEDRLEYGSLGTDENEEHHGDGLTLEISSSSSESQHSITYPNKMLNKILEKERTTRWSDVLSISALFVCVTVINILKGGGVLGSPLGIECGSFAFWATEALILLLIVLFVFFTRAKLLKRTAKKTKANYEYLDGDIPWDSHATIVYPAICSLAGLAAGLFGIGGGVVKGPLMLAMGVHPSVASATSACMILFTSSTATTTYAIFGLLKFDYAIVCVVIGFLATLIGQTVMHLLLEKYQRNSYIAYSIGIVVAVSTICMTVESMIALMNGGDQAERGGFCGSKV